MTSSRYRAGQSGNPRGRPPGSRNRKTIIKDIAREKVLYRDQGQDKVGTILEVALLELRNHVAQGRATAMRYSDYLLDKYGKPLDHEKYGVLVAPAEISPEEWIERELKKNETRTSPPE